jgi:histidyl-tRNA synthetase
MLSSFCAPRGAQASPRGPRPPGKTLPLADQPPLPPEAPRFPLQSVRGVKDVLPAETPAWRHLEAACRDLFGRYGLAEIRTPAFEPTPLFARSIGAETDIVEKEMYTFVDRNGQSLSLRPEGTAGVIRAYIQHGLQQEPLTRLYYLGPMFRHERPQAGRLRQFHQIGVEVLGSEAPGVDVEVLTLLADLFEVLGVAGLTLELNSIGCPDCRPAYTALLIRALKSLGDDALCANCLRRRETNPLRVFDCKVPGCREATAGLPLITDHLCEACRAHFGAVRSGLERVGIPFAVNPRMVRGLDYYTRTAFEWTSPGLGAQNTVAAGGRYDRLVEDLGGRSRPGIGFALGVERLLTLMPAPAPARPDLFAALLGPEAEARMLPVLRELRRAGLTVDRAFEPDLGLKAQLKRANKSGARFCLILGENELKTGVVLLKDMDGHAQHEIPEADAAPAILAAIRAAIAASTRAAERPAGS